MPGEHTFFVRLENSGELRRAVLELSKSFNSILKRFYYIKKIRNEKRNQIAYLSNLFKEIAQITSSLNFEIPDLSLDGNASKEVSTSKKAVKKPAAKSKGAVNNSEESHHELSDIENSVAELEKRINRLLK
ncbi:MAG: hypothetical protein ACQESF_00335 [Nanobdellota archaeon]